MTPDDQKTTTEKRTYPLRTIYFYLTNDCNLRCRHCWIAPTFQSGTVSGSYLSFDMFKSIVEQAKPLGLGNVKLTGGEPLLHPQILEILEYIRSQGLTLGVETNGVLCTPEIAKAIAACKSPFVSVSIDGADAETHEWVRGVDGCFETALNGIRNLIAAGIRPQVIMTVMKKNRGQIEAVLKLAESVGAGSLKYNILTPTVRGELLQQAGGGLSIEDAVKLGEWVEKETPKFARIPVFYSHPLAFRPLNRMFGNTGSCGVCNILSIIGVLADGTYAMCGIGENVEELTCGNAATHPLSDVWANTQFFCELREGLPMRLEGVCGECLMKTKCYGGCIATNYYRTKSLWAPYWYCEEAKRKGIFPASRLRETFI